MNILDMFLNDPVVLISFLGLGTCIGIVIFYIYYFMKNVSEDN